MNNIKGNIDTSKFIRIGLKEAEKAQLMQRVDYKFVINTNLALEILSKVNDSYYIVDNNGFVTPEYISEYFDTENFKMYIDHQNRKPKRYKIRVRKYCASGDSFLEVKLRTPSGKTVKKRIPAHTESLNQTQIFDFIENKTPYKYSDLTKTLITQFERLTLVAKDFEERITFDFNLLLSTPNQKQSKYLNNVCIVEVKRSKVKLNSIIGEMLRATGIRPMGFSKYSMGCALLYPTIKSNNFKKTFIYLKKLQNEHTELHNAIG